MKILVTCKQVPDPDVKVKLNDSGTGINTDGMKFVVNPFDEIANEEALRIIEKNGGEVVVLGIGKKDIQTQIRSCLAMGSNSGIHVATEDVLDSDAVAHIVAKVIEQETPDLVIIGKQAVDDDMGQVAQIVSTLTGMPQACYAAKVEIDGAAAVVEREVDGGIETVKVEFPAIITSDLRLNEPRYASLPNIMKAKRKPIKELTFDALGITPAPKVKLVKMTAPPERKAGVRVPDVDTLVEKLLNEAKVI
jgi:electron transfer flavoprotein beta subunit